MKAKGYILYRGPSLIDGKPIAVVATMKTANPKTGDMVQTWIIRTDVAPHHAVATGDDASVCGDCVHRHHNGGACYVTPWQAPLQVYKSLRAGKYSDNTAEFFSRIGNRAVRMGAYGDPAAVPTQIWAMIAKKAAGHTGYTHQWDADFFDRSILKYVMASVDTEEQAGNAPGRYFRVKRQDDKPLPREVECLADSVGKSCAECQLCDGGTKGKSVYITVHGSRAGNYSPDLIATSAA